MVEVHVWGNGMWQYVGHGDVPADAVIMQVPAGLTAEEVDEFLFEELGWPGS